MRLCICPQSAFTYSKLTIETLVFLVLVFLLLTLNMQLTAGLWTINAAFTRCQLHTSSRWYSIGKYLLKGNNKDTITMPEDVVPVSSLLTLKRCFPIGILSLRFFPFTLNKNLPSDSWLLWGTSANKFLSSNVMLKNGSLIKMKVFMWALFDCLYGLQCLLSQIAACLLLWPY